jgi:hypothetical protein
MDDSFKKLNGPTADGIQSDYIAKEKRAAEELLNLQLGNAKKLADLRSKLLGKLMDEAKEEGKLVEDYLAEYGLQKRLDALASELEAEKKARLGQLNTLDELRKTNSEALAATEEAAAKKQASRQAKDLAARKAALEAQHKTELANIQALNKARKNLTAPELTAGLTLEDTDLQANVSAELDLDSSGLENLTAELAVSPDIADITLPEAELSVKPHVADIVIPDAEIAVKAKVEFDSEIPKEVEISAKVIPEVQPIEDLTVSAVVQPQLADLPQVPDLEGNLKLISETPEIEDLAANLKLATEVESLPELENQLKLTPEVQAIEPLELGAKIVPQLEGDLDVPELSATLKAAPIEPIVEPLTDLEATAKVTPIIDPITGLEADLKLVSATEPVEDQVANLKLSAVVDQIPDQEGKILLTPEITEPLQLEPQTLEVIPQILPLEPFETTTVNVQPVVENIENLTAEVHLKPLVEEIPEQATAVKLTPEVEPVADQTGKLIVTPVVEPIDLSEAELKVVPTVEPIQDLEANLKLLTSVDSVEDQEAAVRLTPIVDPVSDQEIAGKLVVDKTELSNLEADIKVVIDSDALELSEVTTDLTVTPKVLPIDPLNTTSVEVIPVVDPVEPLELEATVKTKVEDLQELSANLKLTPEIDSIPELTANLSLTSDLSGLDGLETTIKAKVEAEIPELDNASQIEAEAAVISTRLTGLSKVQDEELALLSLRQEIEAELAQTRVSSLDALRGKALSLSSLNNIPISADFSDLDTQADDLVSKIVTGVRDALDLAAHSTESSNNVTETNSDTKSKAVKTNDKTDPQTAVVKKYDVAAIEEVHKTNIDTLTANIAAHKKWLATKENLDKEANYELEFEQKQLTSSILRARELAEIAARKRKKLTDSNDSKLRSQIEQENNLRHIKATSELEAIKFNLYKLTLKSKEDLHKEHLNEVRLREVENQTKILQATQELQKLQGASPEEKAKWAAQDAELAKIQALKNLEEERHKTAVMSLKDDEALRAEIYAEDERHKQAEITEHQKFQKMRLRYEDQYKKAKLEALFTGDDKKYAEDPSQLNKDILAQVSSGKAADSYNQAVADKNDQLDIEKQKEIKERLAAAASASEAAGGSGENSEAEIALITQKVEAEFALKKELAAIEIAERYASEDGALQELFSKRAAMLEAEEEAKDEAKKKADKEEEKAHKKRLGQKAELADYGAGGKALAVAGTILNPFGELKKAQAEGLSEEEATKRAQEKLDGAMEAVGNLLNQLASTGKSSTKHQSGVDTRLQGLSTDEKSGGIKKKAGSYWRSLAGDIGKLGASPFFLQETAEERFANLISQGIAFNVKERAFLDVLKDKVATTFNVADGTLLKLVRIQQADTSAARLGMESALTEFLNSMYATTEYMQQAAESIRSNLYEASALMEAKEATEFEFQVQKWMGSLYSVGFSNTEGLSAALGKIAAGDISGVTEGGFGNLLIMAANEAGKPIAEILEKGLTASETDELLESVVNYLSKLYKETQGSRVLAQQFANVYGVTASDLRAAATLAPSVKDITKHNEDFGTLVQQVYDMSSASQMAAKTSTGEMMENMKANFMYSMASTLANSPVLSSLHLVANLLNDLVGGIEIPFVNIMGFGFDLNASVADLMNVAALSGSVLGGIGKMLAGLANLNPTSLLKTFGVEKGTAGLDVQSRGAAAGLTGATAGGNSQSESGYVGNESGDDVKNKTISDASSGPESTVAEAKEDQENKEESRTLMIAGHIVDIYELLQEVTQGTKKFRVQLDVGTNPLSWAGGTWA